MRWRLKSLASPLFAQPFIQVQIKENIKARRHWPLCGESPVVGEFPAQMASNAENVSIFPFDDVIMVHFTYQSSIILIVALYHSTFIIHCFAYNICHYCPALLSPTNPSMRLIFIVYRQCDIEWNSFDLIFILSASQCWFRSVCVGINEIHLLSLCRALTCWGRVTHICVSNPGHHCFRQWLGDCSAPSHYLNQCWFIVNWTFDNRVHWNFESKYDNCN